MECRIASSQVFRIYYYVSPSMLLLHGGHACFQETIMYHRLRVPNEERIAGEMGKRFSLTWTPLCSESVVVKDLIGILQNCVDDPNLPPSIRHIRACAHECWPTENVNLVPLEQVYKAAYPNIIARFPAFILFTAERSCTRFKCYLCQYL